MTYEEYISQFEILENPPIKEGFHRHHIVPKSQQIEKDDRCVYLLPSQHLWVHILYDQENGTKTANKLLSDSHIRRDAIRCYEDCLSYDEIEKKHSEETRQKISKNNARFWKGKHLPQETKDKLSLANIGHEAWHKGKTGVYSQETLERMSNSHKGQTSGMKGKKHNQETLNRISESSKGRMVGTFWFNNGVENRRSREYPGEGWVRGRLKKSA